MPIFASGKYTVRATNSFPNFIDNAPTEFTFYSRAPYVLVIVSILGLLALGLHRFYDPAYSMTKLLALAPGLIGGIAFVQLDSREHVLNALSLLTLTAIFIAWRIFKPKKLPTALIYGLLASMAVTYPTVRDIHYSLFFYDFPPIIECFLAAVVLLFPLYIIRALIARKQTISRIIIAYALGTLVPYFFFNLLVTLKFPGHDYPVPYTFINVAVIPYLALVKWNPWVRDLTSGDLFASQPPTIENQQMSS